MHFFRHSRICNHFTVELRKRFACQGIDTLGDCCIRVLIVPVTHFTKMIINGSYCKTCLFIIVQL